MLLLVTSVNNSLNNVTLLLSQSATEEIEKTISNISNYRSLLVVNIVTSGSVSCVLEIPIAVLKKYPNRAVWCDALNNNNRSSIQYISDTSIKLYASCNKVEIYGIG